MKEFICDVRLDSGECDDEHSTVNKRVNLAYFTVRMAPTSHVNDRTAGNLLLNVKPECNSTNYQTDQGMRCRTGGLLSVMSHLLSILLQMDTF